MWHKYVPSVIAFNSIDGKYYILRDKNIVSILICSVQSFAGQKTKLSKKKNEIHIKILKKVLETHHQKNLCFDMQNCNITDECFIANKYIYMCVCVRALFRQIQYLYFSGSLSPRISGNTLMLYYSRK